MAWMATLHRSHVDLLAVLKSDVLRPIIHIAEVQLLRAIRNCVPGGGWMERMSVRSEISVDRLQSREAMA